MFYSVLLFFHDNNKRLCAVCCFWEILNLSIEFVPSIIVSHECFTDPCINFKSKLIFQSKCMDDIFIAWGLEYDDLSTVLYVLYSLNSDIFS